MTNEHKEDGFVPNGNDRWHAVREMTIGALLDSKSATPPDLRELFDVYGHLAACEGKDINMIVQALLLTVLQIETDGEYKPLFKDAIMCNRNTGEVSGNGVFSAIDPETFFGVRLPGDEALRSGLERVAEKRGKGWGENMVVALLENGTFGISLMTGNEKELLVHGYKTRDEAWDSIERVMSITRPIADTGQEERDNKHLAMLKGKSIRTRRKIMQGIVERMEQRGQVSGR